MMATYSGSREDMTLDTRIFDDVGGMVRGKVASTDNRQ